MTKAFISYHHGNDQPYKEYLSQLAQYHKCFEDVSVSLGEISDDGRSSQKIRTIIRDQYLRSSEVTILLCGSETKHRKHVDWELKSSMIGTNLNPKSGVLVINLPSANSTSWYAAYPNEKTVVYPDYRGGWTDLETKTEYEKSHPKMPERILDNLVTKNVRISVVPWVLGDPRVALTWLVNELSEEKKMNMIWVEKCGELTIILLGDQCLD